MISDTAKRNKHATILYVRSTWDGRDTTGLGAPRTWETPDLGQGLPQPLHSAVSLPLVPPLVQALVSALLLQQVLAPVLHHLMC